KHEQMGNQPPYAEQALMLLLLGKKKIIDLEDMLDYAAGYGKLSRILDTYFQIQLPVFDSYIHDGDPKRYVAKEDLRKYMTVINSAMFEHVIKREDLDQVNDLVDSGGSLIVHTVICERVPCDPNWFYLRPPVHTAFHTNRSMRFLMDQWGYRASVYCPKS